MKNFLDRGYWSRLPDEFAARSVFQPYFDRWLPRSNGEAIEIGAWPGTHLAALTRSHDYRPVALDYQERGLRRAGDEDAYLVPAAGPFHPPDPAAGSTGLEDGFHRPLDSQPVVRSVFSLLPGNLAAELKPAQSAGPGVLPLIGMFECVIEVLGKSGLLARKRCANPT